MKKENTKILLHDVHYMPGVSSGYSHSECISCNCADEGICRNSVIVDPYARISNYEEFIQNYMTDNTIYNYCVGRIFSKFKVSELRANICGGYYGEEFDDVTVENADEINAAIIYMDSLLTDSDKIRYVLNLEYGYLLPELKTATFVISDITIDDIEPIMRKTDFMDPYSVFIDNVPIGVYKRLSNGLYRVIDGNHRLNNVRHRQINNFKILIALQK